MAPKWLEPVRRVLVEALGGSLLGDRAGQTDDRELIGFRPISDRVRGNRTRDLSMLSHKEMVDIGLFLYASNAFAEWLVDMPVALTVGQELGYSVSIDHEKAGMTPDDAKKLEAEIRKTLDPFWYHPAHNINEKASEYARTYMVTGHLVLPVTAINEVSGIPQFDLIDAAQIKGVNGLNGSAIVPGLVRYSPADDSHTQREYAMAVLQQAEDGRLLTQTPGALSPREDMPAGVELKYEGLYFRHNKLLNSLRGIGYLMAVADWVDALDQFTWTTLDRAKLRNAIVYHLKLTGSVGLNLKEETQKLTTAIASPGTVYGSNEGVTVEAVAAKLEGADNVVLGRMILTHVLGSKSMPESWYGSGSESNRSTAETQTDVTYKALLALQNRFRGIFRTMLWCAYDSAQAKQAVFPKRTESPWLTLEPSMTVLQERDVSRMAAGVAQLAAGLGSAIQDKLVSEKTARRSFLDVLGKTTGGTVELDEEEARIESETEEREARAEEMAAEMARKTIGSELDDDEKLQGSKKPAAKTEE